MTKILMFVKQLGRRIVALRASSNVSTVMLTLITATGFRILRISICLTGGQEQLEGIVGVEYTRSVMQARRQ